VNAPVVTAIPATEMSTDAVLGGLGIRVVTVIQDHELHIAENRFDRIVVGAAFGQADPMQFERTHHPAGLPRLAGMGWVLIQDDPNGLGRIPPSHLLHKVTDLLGAFSVIIVPTNAPAFYIIAHKKVEASARFLIALQNQTLGRTEASSAISFDRDRFDIKEQEHPFRR